ncbi:MAG: gluconolaconase [Rhodospirillaceae bacterium]|nr:gluconolaconase [Rhodospirillaceae bacterium]
MRLKVGVTICTGIKKFFLNCGLSSLIMGLSSPSAINSVRPFCAVEGGRITIDGINLSCEVQSVPEVHLGTKIARVVHASNNSVSVVVPQGLGGGRTAIKVTGMTGETAFVDVGIPVAMGLHQVDSPVIGVDGSIYLTFSGSRGESMPVSVYRVRSDGFREPFVSGITNPTSMTFGPDGKLYLSSRFEGAVYQIHSDGSYEVFASDLGIACGLAFSSDGALYVGDRSGTVFRIGSSGKKEEFSRLPSSIAAFHLAWGPDDALYVTAPTLSTSDKVYRIDQEAHVEEICSGFGRPQGLAFDPNGALYVVEALAGSSGVYRVATDGSIARVLAGNSLIGLAFDQKDGSVLVASNECVYRLDSSGFLGNSFG